ncbi:MAG: hypothetical protein PHP01_02050 [Phycisphaerae bacterium]|nr:hypothetical protein [Phycisphaerae bacterium]
MFSQIMGLTVVNGNETIDIGAWPFIIGSLPFIVGIVAILTVFWYFLGRKRFEHQQILAAIEKGTPLSELRPLKNAGADWIRSLTAGVAFLMIGIGAATIVLILKKSQFNERIGLGIFCALVFFAIGVSQFIRGILQRKYDKNLPSKD